jgi:hypothetical protein
VRQQLAGEAHGTEATPLEHTAGGPLDLVRHEAPVERGVVGDEHAPAERRDDVVGDAAERRPAAHHLPRDPGEADDLGGDPAFGVDERLVHGAHLAAFDGDGGDLGDAVARLRRAAGGLDVDHDVRQVGESVVVARERARGGSGARAARAARAQRGVRRPALLRLPRRLPLGERRDARALQRRDRRAGLAVRGGGRGERPAPVGPARERGVGA